MLILDKYYQVNFETYLGCMNIDKEDTRKLHEIKECIEDLYSIR